MSVPTFRRVSDSTPKWPYAPYDGQGNNQDHPNWGAAQTNLRRFANSDYADGESSLAVRGADNPNPRAISNSLCYSLVLKPSPQNLSDMFWLWGQFLDHEIDLTPGGTGEFANVVTPPDDPVLANATIDFERSTYKTDSSPRQQLNIISAYIDGTNVYGTLPERVYALRVLDGSGKLKTSKTVDDSQTLPPLNVDELPNAALPGQDPKTMFLAGDQRANEHVSLTAMHGLFIREHNRICDVFLAQHPEFVNNDEIIYQEARRIVYAKMQVISYKEFLPLLLGTLPSNLATYPGYKARVNAAIFTEFSTVAYRLGHSMLGPTLGTGASTISLKDAFFNPQFLKDHGIEELLQGAYQRKMQKLDTHIIEDVRSFLFGPPDPMNQKILDLAALNLQRGRDHGITDYNSLRAAYGLEMYSLFSQITSDVAIQQKLSDLYGGDINAIDPWIGGLAETPVEGGLIGELFRAVLVNQFYRLMVGDRYWYENQAFDSFWMEDIESTTLGKIIQVNTVLSNIPDNVFKI